MLRFWESHMYWSYSKSNYPFLSLCQEVYFNIFHCKNNIDEWLIMLLFQNLPIYYIFPVFIQRLLTRIVCKKNKLAPFLFSDLPSGNLLHSYWKWPSWNSEFSHKKNNMVFFHSHVSLPHHFQWEKPLEMAIFNSNLLNCQRVMVFLWFSH